MNRFSITSFCFDDLGIEFLYLCDQTPLINNLLFSWFTNFSVEDPARRVEKTSHVLLHSDGTIRWSQPVTFRAACLMNLKAFPFDQQCCSLRFGSWSYDGSLIDLHIPDPEETEPFDHKSEYHVNGEWKLIHATAFRNVSIYEIPANASDTSVLEIYHWPELYFSLQLQRKYNFYLFTLLIPYFLITFLSSLVFFLQPESGEKMSLAITTLLSLVVFNEYVMNIVPPSADFFPLLCKYYTNSTAQGIRYVESKIKLKIWRTHFQIWPLIPRDPFLLGHCSIFKLFGQ